MALASYITQVRRLLHDASGNYWSDTDLTDYINDARAVIAMDSGSIRCLFNFYLSASQEAYPFQGAVASLTVTNAGTGYTAAPTLSFSGGGGSNVTATASIDATGGTVSGLTITANGTGFTSAPTVTFSGGTAGTAATATASIMLALDIMNITVNWGNTWVTLKNTFFTEFQAKARFYRSNTGQPAVWAKGPPANTGGGDYFYIYQIPSTSYQSDIDATVLANTLVDDTTVEQLQYPFTDLVQYNAAALAKFKQQQFEEAAMFNKMYDQLLKQYIASRYQRRIPSTY